MRTLLFICCRWIGEPMPSFGIWLYFAARKWRLNVSAPAVGCEMGLPCQVNGVWLKLIALLALPVLSLTEEDVPGVARVQFRQCSPAVGENLQAPANRRALADCPKPSLDMWKVA